MEEQVKRGGQTPRARIGIGNPCPTTGPFVPRPLVAGGPPSNDAGASGGPTARPWPWGLTTVCMRYVWRRWWHPGVVAEREGGAVDDEGPGQFPVWDGVDPLKEAGVFGCLFFSGEEIIIVGIMKNKLNNNNFFETFFTIFFPKTFVFLFFLEQNFLQTMLSQMPQRQQKPSGRPNWQVQG